MSDQATKDVISAIEVLFRAAGIASTYRVDDLYGRREIEDVIAQSMIIDKERFAALPNIGDLAASKDDSNWADLLRGRWENLSDEDRRDVESALNGMMDPQAAVDLRRATVLEQMLHDFNFTKLSLKEWRSIKPTIARRDQTDKALILFDQDMKYDGGTDDEGVREIKSIVSDSNYNHVLCCLLTHKVTPGEEETYWENFASDNSIPLSRFMVISNERLEGDKYGFVHMLRLTVLAPRFKILVESVVGVLFKSLEEAKAEIEKINNYDFDFIVFRHSREEGIWEPDTIVRLFSLYLRKFTIRSSKLNRDIVNVSDEVRSVTGIVPVSSMEPEHKHAKEIQQFENFETDDVVNELHLPIDLGDIFEKTDSSSKKSFILIAQPCDLMVRPNGLRHQDCKEGIVAEIRTVSDAEIANEPRKFFKLPYYRSKDDNESFVDLRSSHVVKYCILDLCVFQADGRARISIGEDCPRMIVAPWRNRYDLLRKIAEKTLKKHKELMVAGQKPEVLDLLIPPSSNSRLFRGRVTEPGKTLEYACRRTKRLSEVRAVALLGAYSVYLSRPAFERDIGQDL